jgi:hypothetical protein
MKDAGPRNQLWLDLRTEEGRAQVSVDLSSLTGPERLFLHDLFESANTGAAIGFGVGDGDNGAQVMQFSFHRAGAAGSSTKAEDAPQH